MSSLRKEAYLIIHILVKLLILEVVYLTFLPRLGGKWLTDWLKVTVNRKPMFNIILFRKLFTVPATVIKVVMSDQVLDYLFMPLCVIECPIINIWIIK